MSTPLNDGYFKNYIAGEWVAGDAGAAIAVEDPATEEIVADCAIAGDASLERALDAARICADARELYNMKPADRATMLRKIADEIRKQKTDGGALLCRESGKTVLDAEGEFEEAAQYFEYYAGIADKIEGKSIPLGPDYIDYTVYEPFGVSAQIVPWNFPVSLAARSLAPALAAGNSVIIKSPELDPLAVTMLGRAVERAGAPAGALSILNGVGSELGAKLVQSDRIDQIVFTGSVPTGQAILRAAAGNVTPCLMELGGKSAAIAFEDADIETVTANIKTGIFFNAGQVCSAMSRLIVHRSIYNDVVEQAVDMVSGLKVGHGLDNPDITPIISGAQLDAVERITMASATDGAIISTGGERLNRAGHYMAPTILSDVEPQSTIAQSEIFGPVLCVSVFDTDDEAIAMANGTDFALVAGVFTKDINKAHRAAAQLRAGQVFVNEWFAGGIATPFGGIGKSGFGREKGVEGLYNYVQTKNVAIRLS